MMRKALNKIRSLKGKGYASQDVKNLTIGQLEHLIANYGYAHSVGREYCFETLIDRLRVLRQNQAEALDYFEMIRREAREATEQSGINPEDIPPMRTIKFNLKY